ncbi:MAG: hypothetical protein RL158_997 [Bacteroidota bacterium]|jgi:hypothetical protein
MAQLVLANTLAGSGNVLAGGDNNGNVTKVTIGSNLTLSGGVLSASGGGTALTLTTTGTSGAATYNSGTGVLNIPIYSAGAGAVSSVFGRTGAVVATTGDYNTDLVTEGSTNLYYSNARARAALSANPGSALTYNNSTGRFTLNAADGGVPGYVTTTDYNYWDSKQDSIGSGTTSQFLRGDLVWAAPAPIALDDITDVAYVGSPTNGQVLTFRFGDWRNETLPSYVPTSRTLTINGVGYDLSANRSWSVGTVTSVTVSGPLYTSGTSTAPVININQATTSQSGYLSAFDWNTFNNKASTAQLANYLPLTGGTLTGLLYAPGYFETSDKRLKKQIEANYAPKNIQDIQTYLYQKDGKIEVGYYAQEVQEIMPYAVAEGKDGFLAVAYNQVLVSKVQYLENKLKQLEHELGRISK